jgi:small GTP-binding protein
MKTFPTANIRNVALVGHGGAGKTSLAEALLFAAGATNRLGKIEDGTTVCDFDPEEQRRRISVSLALAPFELDGHKVNLLDAPGYADFVGDVGAALQAADLALFVVSAVEGVEVQTEVAGRDEERGDDRREQAEDGERVGGHSDPAQAVAYRSETPLHAVPPASVEHAGNSFGAAHTPRAGCSRPRAPPRYHRASTAPLHGGRAPEPTGGAARGLPMIARLPRHAARSLVDGGCG